MLAYILRRLFIAIGTVWVISVVSFAIIQLPPGDYVTSYIAQLMSTGTLVTQEEAANLRAQYGLDQPIYVQYAKWMWQVLQGNFGVSMEWKRPVTEVVGDRLLLTASDQGFSTGRASLNYRVPVSLSPLISPVGYSLPFLVSGSIIVSIVLSLPTVGPLLLKALLAQDMFLAGTIVLLLGVMTVI